MEEPKLNEQKFMEDYTASLIARYQEENNRLKKEYKQLKEKYTRLLNNSLYVKK